MNAELNSIKGKKVLVIGDVMLDTYHIGDVKRISPEAPVPVVRVTRTYNVLGGAANVARNLLGLGCSPYVVSLLGNDHNGNTCIVFPLWSLPSRLTNYGEQPSPNRFLSTFARPPHTL